MTRIRFAILLMLTWAAVGPRPASAQPATAVDAVRSILQGRDDEMKWSELESALKGGEEAALPGAAERGPSVAAETGLSAPARTGWSADPRVVVGSAGAVLFLLVFLALRVLVRTLRRAAGPMGGARRGSRALVRRRGRASTVPRDAARLEAQLRARRAA